MEPSNRGLGKPQHQELPTFRTAHRLGSSPYIAGIPWGPTNLSSSMGTVGRRVSRIHGREQFHVNMKLTAVGCFVAENKP